MPLTTLETVVDSWIEQAKNTKETTAGIIIDYVIIVNTLFTYICLLEALGSVYPNVLIYKLERSTLMKKLNVV